MPGGMEAVADANAVLSAALRAAVDAALSGVDSAELLYSGGLDSSLVAFLVPREVDLTLVTVATEGARDRAAAVTGAHLLGRRLRIVPVGPPEVDAVARRWARELASLHEPLRSVFVSLAVALSATRSERVLCGQGADELFFGYRHFRGLPPEEADRRRQEDWRRLADEEWPRALRVAKSLGRDLRSPFLDDDVARLANGWSAPSSDDPAPAKARLRGAAVALGVPPELAERPKVAMQYGSGIARLVRARDREADRPPSRG